MAIAALPTVFKSFTFGGESSADYGVQILGEGVFNAPERAVELVSVPGRNGSIAIDQGYWENIEVTYPAVLIARNPEEFATAMANFRNMLCSKRGYCRLSDDYHPGEYRMAMFNNDIEVDEKVLRGGEFDITFNCKPQRWLTSGEVPVTIGEWGATKDASGEMVTIESEGGEAAKSLEVSLEPIQDLNGYDSPWVGGAGKNKLHNTANSATINGVTFTVNSDGSIKVNGTATGNITFVLTEDASLASNSYVLDITGFTTQTGSNGGVYVTNQSGTAVISNARNGSVTVNNSVKRVWLYFNSGTVFSNNVLTLQIRLASETDATYEPYSNICPISGHDSVETWRSGRNLLDTSYGFDSRTTNGVTFTVNADKSITVNGTATATTFFNLTFKGAFGTSKPMPQLAGKTVTAKCKNALANPRVNIEYFKADGTNGGTIISLGNDNAVTRTLPSNFYSFRAYIVVTAEATVNNVTLYPQIELGTEVADYEPYQGNTYTTALGRTVYGGTLDVVSGVLTVDRAIVDLGSLTYTYQHSTTRNDFYVTISDAIEPIAGGDTKAVCSCYERMPFSSMQNGGFCISDYDRNPVDKLLLFRNKQYTSADDFKASMSGQTLVYTLETPQTYQLTPQQVTLLVGENHLWSDGSITMQYGDDPNSLWNPTQYDAGPLLAVKGHGDVSFNGYTVAIDAGEYGVINVKGKQTSTNPITYATDVSLYNDGDTIYVFVECDWVLTTLRNIYARSYSNQHDTGVGQTVMEPRSTSGNNRAVGTTIINSWFLSSQDETLTNTFSFDSLLSNETTVTVSVIVEVTWDATNKTLSVSSSVPHASGWGGSHRTFPTITIEAASTKTYLGDPTLVDCELGEAYKVEDGEIISLNKYIELGSDLPKLSPGANDVTTDNTITELKVTPNWWKL